MIESEKENSYLACERRDLFFILMGIAGFYGAFTYSIRGGIFCNAQTGNFVLLAMAIGNMEWGRVLYLLIPISAYLLGGIVSEALPKRTKKDLLIRWDTLLIIIEIIAVIFLGLLPESAPVQISQVTINFICSMQYNTFRQAEGVPMATTFCTNHWRQTSIALVKFWKHHEQKNATAHLEKMFQHIGMIGSFVIGGIMATILCHIFLGKSILFALIPLVIVLMKLLYADLKTEKEKLAQIPKGH